MDREEILKEIGGYRELIKGVNEAIKSYHNSGIKVIQKNLNKLEIRANSPITKEFNISISRGERLREKLNFAESEYIGWFLDSLREIERRSYGKLLGLKEKLKEEEFSKTDLYGRL